MSKWNCEKCGKSQEQEYHPDENWCTNCEDEYGPECASMSDYLCNPCAIKINSPFAINNESV